MTNLNFLLIILGSAASFAGVVAIKCWDCNSLYNPECADPFKPDQFDKMDCSQRFWPQFKNQPGNICRKVVQKVNGQYRYIRGCGTVEDEDKKVGATEHCVTREGDQFSLLVESCSCQGNDGCNHAGHLAANHLTILIPMLMLAKAIF